MLKVKNKIKVYVEKNIIKLYIIICKKLNFKNYNFEESCVLICLVELGSWFDPRSVFENK